MTRKDLKGKTFFLIAKYWLDDLVGFVKIGDDREEIIKEFEKKLYENGVKYIAGIDEAGRGPLAGPVVVASVIMPKDSMIEGVNDSKKISEKKREKI